MIAGNIKIQSPQLLLNDAPIELVEHFRYLGIWLNITGSSDEEILTFKHICIKAL